MKIAIVTTILLICAQAHAADPCPPLEWCGFQQQQPDIARLQQQIDRMRSDAEMERSLDNLRREEARWERVQRDMERQFEQERYQEDLRVLPGMPPR